MFNRTKQNARKNPNATLAGGLPRRDTALPAPPERDMDGFVIGSPEREYGQITDSEGNRVEMPPSMPATPEFIENLKKYFKRCVEQLGWTAQEAAAKLSNSLSLLGVRGRGRPRKPSGAQTPAQRKQHQRQRETDWAWLPFPIIPHAGYLVIEASRDEEMPLFDIHRARIVIGYELQRTMDAHHRDYPDQETPADQPGQHGPEFNTELSGVEVLVLQYPDKVLYIAPFYETPTTGDVLAGDGLSSLNRGLFLTKAPKGKGKLVSGWGHKKGYDKNTSGFEPSLDDVGDFYADEFANEDNDNGPADNPGSWADQPEPEKAEERHPYSFARRELDETVEKHHQDSDGGEEDEAEADVLKCRICREVLEGDDDDSTLFFKHLEERHPDEYQRICRVMGEQFDKAREAEKKRERLLLEKQKHCREDHEGMLKRQLEAGQTGPFYCKPCGTELCRGRHVKMVEDELQRREAYIRSLPYQEHEDAQKQRQKHISCSICRKPIYVTQYEG